MVRNVAASLVLFSFPLMALDAPTGLDASDGAFVDRISLAWDHVRGAEVYRVFRSAVNDPATATSIGITESITFNDTASRGESLFYWVRAEGRGAVSPLSPSDAGSTILFSNLAIISPPAPIQTPSLNPVTGAKVFLGRTLFWDEQLSSTRTVACGTCHRGFAGGSDPRAIQGGSRTTNPGPDGVFGTDDDRTGSRGVPRTASDGSYLWSPEFGLREQVTPRKAQSVIDAALAVNGVLWDGKAQPVFRDPATDAILFSSGASLESQALLPLLNPVEMGHDNPTLTGVVERLRNSRPLALSPETPAGLARWIGERTYPELFEEAFSTPEITPVRIAMAIASYERTLLSDRTPLEAGTAGPSPITGLNVFARSACSVCHRLAVGTDGRFQNTGVRPMEEDRGRGGITGLQLDMGAFRTPSIRNAALRGPLFHTGGAADLEEVVEFYNRGGDFRSVSFATILRPLDLTDADKAALVTFLRLMFTDPRVAAESGPLFSRPVLNSESARVPEITGAGREDANGSVPEMIALEPPYAGNPRFTIGLSGVAPGAQAVLVIDRADPGTGPAIPAAGSFARREVTASDGGGGHGFASVSLAIPNDAAGSTLFGRWFVTTNGSVSVSRAVRFTIFAPRAPRADAFRSVSAASLRPGPVAPESIVSGFGATGVSITATAQGGGLPDSLLGVSVSITDSAGAEHTAPLFFVSPGQVNYLVPKDAADGEAQVRLLSGGETILDGTLQVRRVQPALFAANANGRDTAAALVQSASGVEQVARFDGQMRQFFSAPISLASEEKVLVLFGTGIRGSSAVSATVGGTAVDVLYAGDQSEFAGLDQVNLRLPAGFPCHGEVDIVVTVDGRRANTVRMSLQ